jgi:hypothetical protein
MGADVDAWSLWSYRLFWAGAAIAVAVSAVRVAWRDADARVMLPGVVALTVYSAHQASDWATWLQIAGVVFVLAAGLCGARLLCYAVPPLEGWLWPLWLLWHASVDAWVLAFVGPFLDTADWDAGDPRHPSSAVRLAWPIAAVCLALWSVGWHVQRRHAQRYESVVSDE